MICFHILVLGFKGCGKTRDFGYSHFELFPLGGAIELLVEPSFLVNWGVIS